MQLRLEATAKRMGRAGNFAAGIDPVWTGVADFNKDGKKDVITLNHFSGDVRLPPQYDALDRHFLEMGLRARWWSARGLKMKPPATHHLEKLKNEGLVKVKREGTYLRHSANAEVLQELLGFWIRDCRPHHS